MTTTLSPQIIYGTAWKEDATTALVTTALDIGFRAIDTANQPKHYQEALVGKALAESRIARKELFIQTKFTPITGHDNRVPYDPNAPLTTQVQQSFEGSLKNLCTNYLDSYLLHAPYSRPNLDDRDLEVWQEMESLYRSGKVLQIGISNVNAQQLSTLLTQADVQPKVVQNRCIARMNWDGEVRDLCHKHNITYQGFWLLTGNPKALAHPTITKLSKLLGRTKEQVLYRYMLHRGVIPLSGTTNSKHIAEALDVPSFALPDDAVAELSKSFHGTPMMSL